MILKESFKLINRTRIFISSAYEDALKDTRKIVKDHLEKSGHEVPIFEDGDFGSWESDTLQQWLLVIRI
jgi:predicted secreted acid phosphatase